MSSMKSHRWSVTRTMAKQIEADLRLLSTEAKGYAAVIDAAERGIMKLRTLQGVPTAAADAPGRCAEFVRPFLLACNHADGGKRMLSVAMGAMQRLIMLDAIDRSEPPNILRVLMIQVGGVVLPWLPRVIVAECPSAAGALH
jgi:hypothetical protein